MKQVIYCDLDSLLDTRLGTVMKLNETQGKLLCNNEAYYNRVHDDLSVLVEGISSEEYLEAYKTRDVDTLINSRPTNMLINLTAILSKLKADKINTPLVESIVLEVNLWPYELTEAELEDFKLIIETYAGHDVVVKCMNNDPKNITPLYIKETHTLLMMYDFSYWLDMAFAKLQTSVRLPDVTFMAPALYANKDKIPTEEDEIVEGQRISAFAATEFMLLEYVNIAFQPAVAFSFITPEKFRHAKPQENQTSSSNMKDPGAA